MTKKQFGSSQFLYNLGKRGYFLRYCDCGEKVYILRDELIELFKRADVELPYKEILMEKIKTRFLIPRLRIMVEWRKLDCGKLVPLNRNEIVKRLRQVNSEFWTLERIGNRFGLSKQRIHAILKGT